MTHLNIIRAWKDAEYRLSLSDAERALMPAHPAGVIELAETELAEVGGGFWPVVIFTLAYGTATGLIGYGLSERFCS
jgi:mersacidin/lichenicidin family type 2 lantibiotic